jgi:hypothetical protein
VPREGGTEIKPFKPDPGHTGGGKQMNQERSHILEPRISSPHSKEFTSYGQGVALLIFNKNVNILLVQEAYDDPPYGRIKGQMNLITETQKHQERVKQNIIRAMSEELGSNYSQFILIPHSYRETNGLYIEHMGYRYKYRCASFIYKGNPGIPANKVFHCESGEISDFLWVKLNELDRYDIEPGARLVIEYYTDLLFQ